MTLGVQMSIDFVRAHFATQTWMASCLGSSILYAHLWHVALSKDVQKHFKAQGK